MFIYRELTDDLYIVSDDGVLDVSYDKPEYLEFLKYACKLCDEGLLDPLSFTQNYDTFLSQVTADELIVAMPISGGVGGFGQNVDKYEAANVIKGPNGLQVASYQAPYANTSAYITVDAESPEACFAFLMVGFLPEYDIPARYSVEGLDWEYTTGGEKGMYSALGYDPVFRWLRGDIRQITDQTSVWGGANVTQLPIMNKVGMLVYAYVNDPANRGAIMTADITAIQ
ncbi:MAG: hypothetical protein ACOX8S_01530 [Christensenellales bacterium]|jgi:putative aldouronate transport system substrate-binding protein